MARNSRDQRGQFSTMVRVSGRGKIVPGSNILKKGQKPKDGKWQKKSAYECCDPLPIVGTFYQGGIIGSSTIINNQVMVVDINELAFKPWDAGTNVITGATATALKTGAANTDTIISVQGAGNYAADATRGGAIAYDLPSKDELNEVYTNRIAINIGMLDNGGTAMNLTGVSFWSSSEFSINTAWSQNFGDGVQTSAFAKSDTFLFRGVRWVNY
jgi:hypothetical protein|tara:strand:- start:1621 stop:2262 length:642 start_codon:yes stop_codon:yes gene_type:complete